MLSRSQFYTEMVNKIWEVDAEYQTALLTYIAENVRRMPVEILLKYKCFCVPDDTYLDFITEGRASIEKYGLYVGERCRYTGRLLIPLYDFMGDICGFSGYDDGSNLKAGENHVKYLYQDKLVFDKERNWLIKPEEYREAIERGYIVITDGVFDKLMLTVAGHPSASLLGSNLSASYHVKYLKPIKTWIVARDQDDAGTALYDKCKFYNPNTILLDYLHADDIDDRLKLNDGFTKLNEGFNQLEREGFNLSINIDTLRTEGRNKRLIVSGF